MPNPTYNSPPSVTTWARLEPRTRHRGMKRGLSARIHDPLWSLGRQWQMGEFQGEDAGTPVSARLRATVDPLSRYRPGLLGPGQSAEGGLFDAARESLEARVEGEGILQTQAPGLRASATAGQHFLRLLGWQGAGHYRAEFLVAFPFSPDLSNADLDEASRRGLGVLSGRTVDGAVLYEVFEPFKTASEDTYSWPEAPRIAEEDQVAVAKALTAWLTWYDNLFIEPEPGAPGAAAWIDERLEYSFSVAVAGSHGETVYSAEEYPGGRLDWYAVDRNDQASLMASALDPGPREAALVQTTIPGLVTYPGMPVPRWWEFENANVDFGAIAAGPEDLLRMLLVEFALTYGNDWFLMAVDLPFGTLTRVQSLVVTDTFGVKTLIPSTSEAADGWDMFRTSGDDPGLLLLPVLGPSLESQPVEEVSFLRDEMANMAWAVERKVESPAGSPLDRHEVETRSADADPSPPPPAGADWRYRIATTVPAHWIPLLPVRLPGGDRRLQRGEMVSDPDPGGQKPTRPLGRILVPGQELQLHEEEVPRAGVQVTRAYQYARWADGSTHLWLGRRKRPGRGEGTSGLRFDNIEAGIPEE